LKNEESKSNQKLTSLGKAGKKRKSKEIDIEKTDKKSSKKGSKKLKIKISVGNKKSKKKESTTGNNRKLQKKKCTPTQPSTAGKSTGYTAPVELSSQLAAIVGGYSMPRHEVVKRMWDYIKENNLQDPEDKQMVVCDWKLSLVIPVERFRGFGMIKYLKQHMSGWNATFVNK